jgi:hypothetical protein
MAIFLGKNHLGQTDKLEQKVTDDSVKNIEITFRDAKEVEDNDS